MPATLAMAGGELLEILLRRGGEEVSASQHERASNEQRESGTD
jgi:hypothetical protein